MTTLLGPSGQPISAHRKASPPRTGEAFGQWAGRPGVSYMTLPGGGLMQFNLDRLTLEDFRNMRDHYQVNASLSVLSFMMHQLDWHVECEDQRIADEVELQLSEQWTPLIRGLSQAYWAGYSPMVIQYENDMNRLKVVIDKFKDLRPEECRVNWREVNGYAPPGKVPPKLKVYDGIVQGASHWPTEGSGTLPVIPTENSLWYPLLMENGDYYGKKLLRPAFPSWFFSILMHLYANRYFERFGEPLPIGRADYEAEVSLNGSVVSGQEAMEHILMNLRNRSVVTLPSDRDPNTKEYTFDVEYLEGQMRGADWERYLSRLDEEMSLGLFTPILLFRTADQGSYNLGIGHQQMYMWILNALAGDIKNYIDKYVASRIVDYNFSPNAPRAKWVPRKMGKDTAETLRGMVIELIRTGQAKPSLDELGLAVGMTLQEVRQVTDDGDDDDRIGRPERPRRESPRGVDEPRDTERSVRMRLAGQVANAFKKGTFGDGFVPNLGYQRQMTEAIGQEAAERWYARVDTWLRDASAGGTDLYDSPDEFMGYYENVAQQALEDVLAE